jgi:hypothetical protein
MCTEEPNLAVLPDADMAFFVNGGELVLPTARGE